MLSYKKQKKYFKYDARDYSKIENEYPIICFLQENFDKDLLLYYLKKNGDEVLLKKITNQTTMADILGEIKKDNNNFIWIPPSLFRDVNVNKRNKKILFVFSHDFNYLSPHKEKIIQTLFDISITRKYTFNYQLPEHITQIVFYIPKKFLDFLKKDPFILDRIYIS